MGADRNGDKLLVGQVLEEDDLVSLADLCRSCTVETKTITTLVAEGILDPMGRDVEHWCFTVGSLRRVNGYSPAARPRGQPGRCGPGAGFAGSHSEVRATLVVLLLQSRPLGFLR